MDSNISLDLVLLFIRFLCRFKHFAPLRK